MNSPLRLLAVAVLALAVRAQSAPPQIDPRVLAPLEAAARQSAAAARATEVTELLELLTDLGWPADKRAALTKACTQELARAGPTPKACPDAARALTTAARQLQALALKDTGPSGDRLAALALRMDGRLEDLQKRFERDRVGERWLPVAHRFLRERRVEILNALRDARELPVDLESGELADERLRIAGVERGVFVRREPFELRTSLSRPRAEQLMRDVFRCIALSRWLRGGALELPPRPKVPRSRIVFWVLDTRKRYELVRERLKADGLVAPDDLEVLEDLGSFNDLDGGTVIGWRYQEYTTAELLTYMSFLPARRVTPFTAGHLNWITTNYLDTPLPNFAWKDPGSRGGDTIAPGASAERAARIARESLAWAGVEGGRTWMQYLAERREDPPIARSFVLQLGQVRGDDLLKCTSVVEFLQETNQFGTLYKALTSKDDGDAAAMLKQGVAWSVGELEQHWRDWLLAGRTGLAERLAYAGAECVTDDARALASALDRVRAEAFGDRVPEAQTLVLWPELGARCTRHAEYLAALAKTGRSKEGPTREDPAVETRTPEGAWAAAQSIVLAVRDRQIESALLRELDDLGHRITLLDPGLDAIRVGSADAIMLVDARTLCAPHPFAQGVTWPFEDQAQVPLTGPVLGPTSSPEARAAAKLGLGYPILLIARAEDSEYSLLQITLRLLQGSGSNLTEVECASSNPDAPTDPALALHDTWVLVPKAPLRAGTKYTVEAQWSDGRTRKWSFKTK
ncbi:MAG: hypothetical protein IPJ77_05925 [Planctomycetes bacterium]|nr:hypothetical protein [Planctomycetota bacterium]